MTGLYKFVQNCCWGNAGIQMVMMEYLLSVRVIVKCVKSPKECEKGACIGVIWNRFDWNKIEK